MLYEILGLHKTTLQLSKRMSMRRKRKGGGRGGGGGGGGREKGGRGGGEGGGRGGEGGGGRLGGGGVGRGEEYCERGLPVLVGTCKLQREKMP